MSFQAKRELLLQVSARYRVASHHQKSIILDEFIAATGYAVAPQATVVARRG